VAVGRRACRRYGRCDRYFLAVSRAVESANRLWKKDARRLALRESGAPEDEYFAAGITEEITSRLATIKELG